MLIVVAVLLGSMFVSIMWDPFPQFFYRHPLALMISGFIVAVVGVYLSNGFLNIDPKSYPECHS